MASGNSNNSVLVILALAILVLLGGFVAYRSNVFGGGDGGHGDGGHSGRGRGGGHWIAYGGDSMLADVRSVVDRLETLEGWRSAFLELHDRALAVDFANEGIDEADVAGL